MRDFLRSRDHSYLVQSANLRGQATMYAQYFTINDGSQGKEVKDLATGLPDSRIAILLLAFLVKAIYLGDLA